MAKTNINPSDLDFDGIKTKLKTYLQSKDEFADYDFEGSALSNVLDVLAYNSHINALTANMAINESFLETAQLRGSIVTHSHSLGYYPTSMTASNATLNIVADLSGFIGDRPSTITLPEGFKFTTTVEDVAYTFRTQNSYTAVDDGGGSYVFVDENGSSEIKVYEGTYKTKTFLVPSSSDLRHYIINDVAIDTETLTVRVYENTSTTDYVTYNNIVDAVRITDESTYYVIQETPNGNFELQFTDGGNVGRSPDPGNKVEAVYIATNGPASNGANTFVASDSLTVEGQDFSVSVTTQAAAGGGSEKEGISSIKFHAPIAYASQRRMVTAQDYHIQITSNYSFIEDVISWGGEDNIPIDYGKIYISIKYPEETSDDTKTETQDSIVQNLIEPLGTVSISAKFIEPIYTYIGTTTSFDFNPSLSGITIQATGDRITAKVAEYFNNNLGQFEEEFRRSTLLTEIDNISPAVLSSKIDVSMNQRLTPILNFVKTYDIIFPVKLAIPDDVDSVITSTAFRYKDKICTIRNKFLSQNLEIIDGNSNVVTDSIGTYDPTTGEVNIVDFSPQSIIGGASFIKISAIPAKQSTIKPLRNYLLVLDDDLNVSTGTVDFQKTRVSI